MAIWSSVQTDVVRRERLIGRLRRSLDRRGAILIAAGWPTGIALIGRSLRPDAPGPPDPGSIEPTMARYFAGVEAPLQDFLVRTAALPFVEAELCDAALGRADSAQLIARIVRERLFLTRREDGRHVYRYHGLFRDFLLAELQARLSTAEARGLRVRAAQYLLGHGQIEEAAALFIAAADWARLADLLRTHNAPLVHAGQAQQVLRWLDQVPADRLSESPWLLLARGRCLRVLDLPGDIHSIQRRAQILFARQGERVGRAEALREEAKVAWINRNTAEAAALCGEALSIAGDDARVRIEILTSLIFYFALSGRLDQARNAGREALDLLPRIEDAPTRTVQHMVIKRQLGLAHAYGGDFHGALALQRQACALADSPEVNDRVRARAWYVHGYVSAMRGDFDDALGHLDRAERIARAGDLTGHLRRIQATRANVLATLGREEDAEAQFREARWFADGWIDPGYYYYRCRRYHEAVNFCESELATAGPGSDPVPRARAQALLGASLVALGNVAAGKQLLEEALAVYRGCGYLSRVPGIGLHLADLAFAEGRNDAGRALLAEALAIAHSGGAYHFFASEPGVLERSLERARALGIERQFVSYLRGRWLGLPVASTVESAGAAGSSLSWLPYRELLEPCPDERIRDDLGRALADGRVTARGLRTLLTEYGLTWRELHVFVRYYVPGQDGSTADAGRSPRRRLDLAAELGVTEHTVRQHVNAIRSKIGVTAQRSLTVYDWAVSRSIV